VHARLAIDEADAAGILLNAAIAQLHDGARDGQRREDRDDGHHGDQLQQREAAALAARRRALPAGAHTDP
jgi:hypothetical protein